MKALIFTVLLSALLGCSSEPATGPSSLAELESAIRSAYIAGDGEEMIRLTYNEGASEDLKAGRRAFLLNRRFGLEKASLESITVHDVHRYNPKVDLPGTHAGRQLTWCLAPSHWVVLSKVSTNGASTSRFTLEFPVGEIDGSWFISGAK
jgi:hypothetical protein